jgi:hypothetical protein
LSSALPFPFKMAFVVTLKNPHPQPSLTTLVDMLPIPLVGVCVIVDHCVAFIVVVVLANVKVLLMPTLLPPQLSSLCHTPGGRRTEDNALIVIFNVFHEDDESSSSEGSMILN